MDIRETGLECVDWIHLAQMLGPATVLELLEFLH